MVNHGLMSHCGKDCLYENKPWLTLVKIIYFRVYNIYLRFYIPWVYNNHGPMPHCDNDCLYENQPWSTMVRCHIMTKIVSIRKSIMLKHGQTWSNIEL